MTSVSTLRDRHGVMRTAARVLFVGVTLITGSITGCVTAAPPATAATHPTTRSTTTRATTHATTRPAADTFKLVDSIPIEVFQGPGAQVDLVSKFLPPQAGVPIFFGTASNSDGDGGGVALIAEKLGDQMRAIPLEDARLSNPQWMYTGAGPALGEIWGVLDDTGDAPAADLLLVHSTDAGATWHLSAIHKPVNQADFSDFVMDREGHGRLSVYLSADCPDETPASKRLAGPRQPGKRKPRRDPIKAGSYHYRTTDGGKTWAMQYEADALTPGGDVPDEDQPQAKTLVKFKR